MPATQFDRDSMARWYAREHLATDPGIVAVHYLPNNAGPREVRLVEVNELLADRNDEAVEPIDFGVDLGMESAHRLLVLDLTPDQWNRVGQGALELPDSWSLEGAIRFER